MKKLFAASLAAVAFAAAVLAQAPAPPPMPPPGGVPQVRTRIPPGSDEGHPGRLKESGRPATHEDVNAVSARTAEYASACAAQFAEGRVGGGRPARPRRTPDGSQQLDAARQTIARGLAAPGADQSAQAATLAAGVRILSRQIRQPGVLAQAEAYVDELEKLPASFVRERIEAHGVLNGYYRADDIDAGIIKHSTRLIALYAALHCRPADTAALEYRFIERLHESPRRRVGRPGADGEGARLASRRAGGTQGIEGVAERLAPTIERYELVGKPAAAIEAPSWLNAPAGTTKMEMAGG